MESLATKLYDMRKQEEQELERRRSETEEEKERRVQEEEVMRKREEERRKICQRKNEERRKEAAAAASKIPAHPPRWDAVLQKNGGVQPALVPMFNLSMNKNKQVLCKYIKEECPQDMHQGLLRFWGMWNATMLQEPVVFGPQEVASWMNQGAC